MESKTNPLPFLILLCFLPFSCQSPPYKITTSDFHKSMQFHGMKREYWLHLPASYSKGKPLPLLIILHGGKGTAEHMMTKLTSGQLNKYSDQYGFIAAYPQGIGKSWNDGRPDLKSEAHEKHLPDADFLTALIDEINLSFPLDRGRVFMTGISNGGFMSMTMACQKSNVISGIAAVAANLPIYQKTRCKPDRSIPILLISGTEDPIVPYKGGKVSVLGFDRGSVIGSEDTANWWARTNGCSPDPKKITLPNVQLRDNTRTHKFIYSLGCSNGSTVELYSVEGGGHTWPGGFQYLPSMFVGTTSRDFEASYEIVNFFGLGEDSKRSSDRTSR